MANRPSLPARNRRHTYARLRATWLRIIEDGKIDPFERAEMAAEIDGSCRFADALASNHQVRQASERATDPDYLGDLIAINAATMRGLPDEAA